jgi:hypothetical protein
MGERMTKITETGDGMGEIDYESYIKHTKAMAKQGVLKGRSLVASEPAPKPKLSADKQIELDAKEAAYKVLGADGLAATST